LYKNHMQRNRIRRRANPWFNNNCSIRIEKTKPKNYRRIQYNRKWSGFKHSLYNNSIQQHFSAGFFDLLI
jgi:hypothetical protein